MAGITETEKRELEKLFAVPEGEQGAPTAYVLGRHLAEYMLEICPPCDERTALVLRLQQLMVDFSALRLKKRSWR